MANIVLDCMGGDNSPEAPVKGAILCLKENKDLNLILAGRENDIIRELNNYKYDNNRIEIIDASDIICGNDEPVKSIRSKSHSSLVVALNELIINDYDAIVSTGNSGAFLAGCMFIVKKINGVDRPALAPIISRRKGKFILLDSGANVDCDINNLIQFAELGRTYYKVLFDEENPSVKLLNIGTEENKGSAVIKKVYSELKRRDLNFKGNLEARDIFNDNSDVVVCDGFVGNIALKIMEGTSKHMLSTAVDCLSQIFFYKSIGKLLAPIFKNIRNKYDYQRYGGAIFLGAKKICIKSHGNSNETSIKNSINTAKKLVDKNFIEILEKNLFVK